MLAKSGVSYSVSDVQDAKLFQLTVDPKLPLWELNCDSFVGALGLSAASMPMYKLQSVPDRLLAALKRTTASSIMASFGMVTLVNL